MTREVSGYNGRDGKRGATAKYDEIKNTVVAGERRGSQEEGGKNSRACGARERSLSGPSPQGVSHVRGNTLNRKTNIGADK